MKVLAEGRGSLNLGPLNKYALLTAKLSLYTEHVLTFIIIIRNYVKKIVDTTF